MLLFQISINISEVTHERPNGISHERMWDEFTKSFKTSKSFSKYVDLITEFGLWEYILPNLSINLDNVSEFDSIRDLSIIMASLLKDNKTGSELMKKLDVAKVTDPKEIRREINFLISLLSLNYDNSFDLYNQKLRNHITDELIEKWILINGLPQIFSKFLEYNPVIKTSDIINDFGLETNSDGELKNKADGRFIGIEKRKRALDLFKNI